ncbi:outer membrane beta-barrel protein [Candidatus Palauibacter sp.]|uniref:outer membrane beta-barrel protein n=1 Tax=Candidatus Palauibacter sp. TaxID=3101350 RepID=UPI003CC58B1A
MTRTKRSAQSRWGWLLLSLACAVPSSADAQIGVLAGYNRDALEEFVPANGFDFTDLNNGFHIGIFLNLNLATFALRPALVYHRVPGLVARGGEDRLQFDLDLLEIPVDVRIRFPFPAVSPYLLAGPVFIFPSSTVEGVDDLLTARPIRAEFGAGLELDLGLRLWPEVRYGFGINSLMGSEVPVGSTVLRGDGKPRLDTLTLRLGISF